MNPVTLERLAVLVASGFGNESEFSNELLAFIDRVGQELLNSGSLSGQQTKGVRSLLHNTPIALAAFGGLISLARSDEDKANFTYLLAKLMDDMMSFGATALVAGNKEIAFSVLKGARRGGAKSVETRRKMQMAWQRQALELAISIRKKNGNLTQDDIATKLTERWRSEWPKLPKRRSILAFLSASVRKGDLGARVG